MVLNSAYKDIKNFREKIQRSFVVSLLLTSTLMFDDSSAQERFKNVEIRVIRPKFFNKMKRFELGAQFSGVMNETFIYTFLASGLATYHINEVLGIEGGVGYGVSIDKEDKRILFDEFKIKTKIFITEYLYWGSLLWTPVYGKWQLPGGRLVYFDTFLSAGFGQTGISWRYNDFCEAPDSDKIDDGTASPIPADATIAYPTLLLGLGQRYFLDKKTAIRWDIRGHTLFYSEADSACDPQDAPEGSGTHQNITLSMGYSKFL